MSLRIVEIVLPAKEADQVADLLRDFEVHELWQRELADERASVWILIESNQAESVLDKLDKHFIWGDRARLMLYSVDATRPKIQEPEEEEDEEDGEAGGDAEAKKKPERPRLPERISRDELEQAIAPGAKVSRMYLALVILSGIIAALGLIRNDVVLLIGAMVIAPLLGPNMALAFGTTLGDLSLIKRAGFATGVGVALATVFALLIGLVIPFDPNGPAIAARTQMGLGDILIALAAGGAGALAFTSGAPASLVGVMVAVALLPPTVAVGMLLGDGEPMKALGALTLLAGNIICVNLSAMVAFMVQGIGPRTWWDQSRAKRALWIAGTIWTVLLGLLVLVILLSQR